MKRKNTIVLIIVALCVVAVGTTFGVLVFTTWGEIDYENTYTYEPSSPASIERININSDIGNVRIRYNETPTNYYAKLDLDIHIEGILVEGSSFSDFFNPIVWDNESTPITTFTLDAKATTWFIFGVFRQIEINLTLRTDVVYDLNILTSTGGINVIFPEDTTLNNTILSTSTGNIFLNASKNITFQGNVGLTTSTGFLKLYAKQCNFTHDFKSFSSTGNIHLNLSRCSIGGHVTGTSSTGNIVFNSYNMKYVNGYNWRFESSTGGIGITILQYEEMGANITGSIQTSTGNINIYYKDSLATIGADFTCSSSTGSKSYIPIDTGGFTESGANPKIITSDDYGSATNKYTLTATSSTGSVTVRGESL
ncbi:MAG: hypothetical protein ACFE9S_13170 [Candidatus Hermodarchaeota archaeon]